MQDKTRPDNSEGRAITYLIALVVIMALTVLFSFYQAKLNNDRETARLRAAAASETRQHRLEAERTVLSRNATQTRTDGLPVWSIEEFIDMQARHYGVDADLAKAIINAEGDRGLKGAMVPNSSGVSSAYGPWQILTGTWNDAVKRMGLEGADRNNYAVNIEVGMWILSHDGTNPWISSINGWGKSL